MFEEFVDNLNKNPPKFDLQYFSARDLVSHYRRKTLILFKLILLQKKVKFISIYLFIYLFFFIFL
jgi:hypothetical protein